jgi:hypothetical protein
MQHIHGERGEQSTQNKLIMLLPMKKRRANDGGRTSRAVKNMRWRTRHGTVNKVKNTLTKEIWLHLHSPIEIIYVRKF